RAVSARAGDHLLHDHRPPRSGLALARLRGPGGRGDDLAGHARPPRAVHRHLPGPDLRHRVGGRGAQPGEAGEPAGGGEPGRARRGGTGPPDVARRGGRADRIARELHDVVAHHVSLMAGPGEAATAPPPRRPAQAKSSVEIIGSTARQALTELRRLLGVLRGPSEQLETAPSASLQDIGDVLDQVRGTGLPVDFTVVGTPYPLAPGVDLTAYRIVQEALTNTVRRARAARAAVTLSKEPEHATVSIADSGRRRGEPAPGANGHAAGKPGPLLAGSGLGLAGIAERVASCGGNLTVGPTGGHGFAGTPPPPSP